MYFGGQCSSSKCCPPVPPHGSMRVRWWDPDPHAAPLDRSKKVRGVGNGRPWSQERACIKYISCVTSGSFGRRISLFLPHCIVERLRFARTSGILVERGRPVPCSRTYMRRNSDAWAMLHSDAVARRLKLYAEVGHQVSTWEVIVLDMWCILSCACWNITP